MIAQKAANVALITLIGLFLSGPIAFQLALHAGINFPDWMEVNNEKSSLEGRTYAELPPIEWTDIQSSAVQTTLEKYMADHVPMRDNVLLTNAHLQRTCIRNANAVFAFEAYPTFFNSDTVITTDGSLLLPISRQTTPDHNAAAERMATLTNELAIANPDKRFVYNSINSAYSSETNPTHKYRSSAFAPAWAQNHILSRLTAKNITVIQDPINSLDELKTRWLTTEHHWTLERALQSYNHIADALDLTRYAYRDPIPVEDAWYGARCRLGLDLDVSSTLYDIPTDFSQIEWQSLAGKPQRYGKRESFLMGENPYMEKPTYNVYNTYYGTDTTRAINRGDNNGRKCLVICVSYITPLKGYIASNYEETLFITPGKHELSEPFSEYLDEGFDDIIIQLADNEYASILKRSPAFMN